MNLSGTLLSSPRRPSTGSLPIGSIRPSATLHRSVPYDHRGRRRRTVAGVGGGCLLAAAAGLGTLLTGNADAASHAAPMAATDAAAAQPAAAAQRLTSATALGRQLAGTEGDAASRSSVRPALAPRTSAQPAGTTITGPSFTGVSSWYGPGFEGRPTASGQPYEEDLLTAASRTLPLLSHLRVCRGSLCVVVLVNDRGPVPRSRILDLSEAAAARIGLLSAGAATITATPVG